MNLSRVRTSRYLILNLLTIVLLLTGCSSSEEADPVTPPPTPVPLVINDLVAVQGTSASITLGWTSPQLSNKVIIQYDVRYIAYGSEDSDWDTWTVGNPPQSDTTSGINKTHTVIGLTLDQVYVFRVAASTDGVEWAAPSNMVAATAAQVIDTTPPAPVTNLFLYKSTGTSLTVAWPPTGDDGIHGDALSYVVRYATAPITAANWDAAMPATGLVTDSTLPDMKETAITGLVADQEYHVALKAKDDLDLESTLSNVVTATTADLRTIFVNVEGTGDYPTIEHAINAAVVGDLILVAPGRYTWANQATGDSLQGLIHVLRDQTDFEVRSIAGPEATILDAQLKGRVMTVTGGPPPDPENPNFAGITIDGFTFTNGRATATVISDEEGWSGGGLNLHMTDTVVRNCIFRGNEASNGGALWMGGQGESSIENCLFEDNKSKLGGAIMMINSEPRMTLRNCTIRDNHATFAGGGIFAINVAFTMEDLLIVGNDSSEKGGGLSVSNLNEGCVVRRCTIADNEGTLGSAVRMAEDSVLRIESSLLAFNFGGPAFSSVVRSTAEIGCTLVFGHELGNQFPVATVDLGGNLETDPLFCDRTDYLLWASSPCLPGNHPNSAECGVIGARGVGCGF